MKKNKVIIPTGYMASGSSVVTDLISEFEGYDAAEGSFEYDEEYTFLDDKKE